MLREWRAFSSDTGASGGGGEGDGSGRGGGAGGGRGERGEDHVRGDASRSLTPKPETLNPKP